MSDYPRTLTNAYGTNTIYRLETVTWQGRCCREVVADGPPEAFFGNPDDQRAKGVTPHVILDFQEIPGDSRWIARYLPDGITL